MKNSDKYKFTKYVYVIYIILLICKFNKESIYFVLKIKITFFSIVKFLFSKKNGRYFGDTTKKSFAISVFTVYIYSHHRNNGAICL